MSNKRLSASLFYHRMKLAKIILDWSSRKDDPPWSLQDPKHSRSLVVGRLESVA